MITQTNKEYIHNKETIVTEAKLSEPTSLKTYFQLISLCIHYVGEGIDPSISMSYVIKIIYFSPLLPSFYSKYSLFLSFKLPFLTIKSLFFTKIRLFDKLAILLIPLFSMVYKIKGLVLQQCWHPFFKHKKHSF